MTGEEEKSYLLFLVSKMENRKTSMFLLKQNIGNLAELEVENIPPLSVFSFTVKQIFR